MNGSAALLGRCWGAFWWHPAASTGCLGWIYAQTGSCADTGPVPAISTPQGDRGYYAQGDTSSGANIIQGDPQISLTGGRSIICK